MIFDKIQLITRNLPLMISFSKSCLKNNTTAINFLHVSSRFEKKANFGNVIHIGNF